MKIEVCYSYIYDAFVQHMSGKNFSAALERSGRAFASKLQKEIDKNKRIFSVMSKASKLKWKEKKVKVYVVHNIAWDFSDPVTILICKDVEDAFETTVHEFSHQLIIQNLNKYKANNKIEKRYKHEHGIVREHILAHAILYKTYTSYFGQREAEQIIRGYRDWRHHCRAWEIVLQEGADRILKAYLKKP